MRHPEQNIALLLLDILTLWVVFNLYRYYTHDDYADRQERRLQIFVAFSSVNLILACLLMQNDIIAWYRDYFVMYVWPFEHKLSLQKVSENLVIALVTYAAAWLMVKRKIQERWLPGIVPVLILSLLTVALSAFSTYVSAIGHCCESSTAVFSGLPFTIARGIVPDNLDYQMLSQLSLIELLTQKRFPILWEWMLNGLCLSLLFWGTTFVMLLTGLKRLFAFHRTA